MNFDAKIKSLENQIATLKSEKALQDRLYNIQKRAKEREDDYQSKIDELTERYADLKMQIDEYCGRISNLFALRDELMTNGYELPDRYDPRYNLIHFRDNTEIFVEDTFWHSCRKITVRLFFDENDEPDIVVDTEFFKGRRTYRNRRAYSDLEINSMEACLIAMNDFIKDFDDFEKYVFDYVDNL